jgi:endo-1,4-beta-mannosidase
MEGWADSPDEIKLPWHKEMSDYLRSIDPFGHLITTSFWSKTGPEEYWQLENIDIVQTHCYTNDDSNVAEAVRRYCCTRGSGLPSRISSASSVSAAIRPRPTRTPRAGPSTTGCGPD